MAFVTTFNKDKPLQEQVDFPIEAEGLEMIVGTNDDENVFFVDKIGDEDFGPVKLTRMESMYMAILMMDGYVSTDEFKKVFCNGIGGYDAVHQRMSKVRRKVEKGIIKSAAPTGESTKGFYIGDLADHRNEEENLARYYGFVLNTLTRCLRISDEKTAYLTDGETQVMEIILISDGAKLSKDIARSLYGSDDLWTINDVEAHISRINNKLGGKYIKLSGHNKPYVLTHPE